MYPREVQRLRHGIGPFLPVLLALAVWALGTTLALRHVILADDFVMAEVRRHGLVLRLLAAMGWFSLPYLAAGVASVVVARGLLRLRSRPAPAGLADGLLGSALLLAFFSVSTVEGLAARPAMLAGLFYLKGGFLRGVQLAAERVVDPAVLATAWRGVVAVGVAAAVAGWLRRVPRSGATALLALAAITVAVGASRIRDGLSDPSDRGRPNVLLVVVDSLRPDAALDPATAPRMARFAGESVRFADARTPLARTYPSFASLFTGRHPVTHGVRDHYPEKTSREIRFAALPRLLADAGWKTAAAGGYCSTALPELRLGFQESLTPRYEVELVVASVVLRAHPLLPVWLDRPWARTLFPAVRAAVEGGDCADIAREAIAWWRKRPGPFFMTVFLDNPHLPYVPVWPESARAGAYEGPNRYGITSGDSLEEIVREGERASRPRGSEAERDNMRRLYRGAVSGADRAFGRLLDALERDGLSGRTIVVLMADHGENLLDVGGPLAHGEAVERDGSFSVPWMVRWPGRLGPSVVEDPVSVMDFPPTILELLDRPVPDGLEGMSLVSRMNGGPALPERALLLETGMWFFAEDVVPRLDPSGRGLVYPSFTEGLLDVEPGDPPHIVVAEGQRDAFIRAKHRRLEVGRWALVYLPRTTGGAFRLYRRDRDPLFEHDLSAEEPEKLREMVARFYEEAGRLGETTLLQPEDPLLRVVAGS